MRFAEFIEIVRIAFDSLKANKLRSFLASLGVVIGISVVLIMGWALAGFDKAMLDMFNSMGVDMMYIDKWDWSGGKRWDEIRARKDITIQQANDFCKRIKSAELAFPSASVFSAVFNYAGDTYRGINLSGTKYLHAYTPSGEVQQGRHFSMFEDELGSNVVVFGIKSYKAIFPNDNGIGKTIKINGNKYTVIGVLKKQGTFFIDFLDNQAYIPLNNFLSNFGKYRSIEISVKAGSVDNMDAVREEARGLMRTIRNQKPDAEDDFSINEINAFESIIDTFRLYVWGIGIGMTILSFIVGIIGIMNIMFVSVTERTKEIGIRKALGAKKRTIWMQFIVESTALCFSGAVISIGLCAALVYLVGTYLPKYIPQTGFLDQFLPQKLLLIATAVSIFVGVLAGLIPAIRAASLNPVDALRYE
ncbi:MAG: hypothetical protein QG635_1030 [Bacteroidota bacterium]|nr:hypothetical protein [Bacteroidota bacterium]